MARILATSTEYVRIPIDHPDDIDPEQYGPPEACLHADNGTEPGEDEWMPAAWIGGEVALLVGPGTGGHVYQPGDYMAFARVTADVEQLVLPSGRVRIGL